MLFLSFFFYILLRAFSCHGVYLVKKSYPALFLDFRPLVINIPDKLSFEFMLISLSKAKLSLLEQNKINGTISLLLSTSHYLLMSGEGLRNFHFMPLIKHAKKPIWIGLLGPGAL